MSDCICIITTELNEFLNRYRTKFKNLAPTRKGDPISLANGFVDHECDRAW